LLIALPVSVKFYKLFRAKPERKEVKEEVKWSQGELYKKKVSYAVNFG